MGNLHKFILLFLLPFETCFWIIPESIQDNVFLAPCRQGGRRLRSCHIPVQRPFSVPSVTRTDRRRKPLAWGPGANTPHGSLAGPRQPLVSSSNTPSCPYAASLTRQTLRFSFQTPYFPSRTSSPFLYRFHIFSTHQVAKAHDFRVNKSEITAAKSTKKDKIFAKSFSYP